MLSRNELDEKCREGYMNMWEDEGQKDGVYQLLKNPGGWSREVWSTREGEEDRPHWYVACCGTRWLPQSCEKPGKEWSQQRDVTGFAFGWITVFRALSLGEASSQCQESHTSGSGKVSTRI